MHPTCQAALEPFFSQREFWVSQRIHYRAHRWLKTAVTELHQPFGGMPPKSTWKWYGQSALSKLYIFNDILQGKCVWCQLSLPFCILPRRYCRWPKKYRSEELRLGHLHHCYTSLCSFPTSPFLVQLQLWCWAEVPSGVQILAVRTPWKPPQRDVFLSVCHIWSKQGVFLVVFWEKELRNWETHGCVQNLSMPIQVGFTYF